MDMDESCLQWWAARRAQTDVTALITCLFYLTIQKNLAGTHFATKTSIVNVRTETFLKEKFGEGSDKRKGNNL